MSRNGFQPDWPCPANVGCWVTTRGALNDSPYSSNNLALHVKDDPIEVRRRRQQLLQTLNDVRQIQWLQQVHGTECLQASGGSVALVADAVTTTTKGLACAVLTADCLPILLCNRQGTQVAAVHAGWRGLANGILNKTVQQFAAMDELLAYIGPAIGAAEFEVGPEVRQAFRSAPDHLFTPGRGDRLYADLAGIAHHQLNQLGVSEVFGGDLCTVKRNDEFYSYRKEDKTGRMASMVWLRCS